MADQASGWGQFEAEPSAVKPGWDQFESESGSGAPNSWGDYGKAALSAVGKGLATVDSYTGAPVRAAVYAAETSPTELGRPGAAINAFATQFGKGGAPTGKDIVNAGGYVTPDSTLAKVAGFGTDIVTNPTSYVPIGEIVSGGAKALGLGAKAAEVAADAAPAAADAASNPVSAALGKYAAKKAVTATGATGAQAAKFAPGAGKELLDRGLVSFGDSQAKVAQKISSALDQAGQETGNVIDALGKKGVTVDHADIIASLKNRATQLSEDPSQFGVSDQLNKLADRIQSQIEAKGGNSLVPIGTAENIKKGFQAVAKYGPTSPEYSLAKEAGSVYRQAVEDAATQADPAAAKAFINAKKTYALLNPIQEAAAKRAMTFAQSPHGGLMDTVATIAGEGVGGIPGAIVAPMARRALATRVAPALAGAANGAAGAIDSVAGAARAIPGAVMGALTSPAGQAATGIGTRAILSQPALAAGQSQSNRSPAGPTTGPDAWAGQGLRSLGIQDPALSKTLLADPKAKQLLIEASNYPAGSKQAKRIMSQIKTGWWTP